MRRPAARVRAGEPRLDEELITVAVPKGRLLQEASALFERDLEALTLASEHMIRCASKARRLVSVAVHRDLEAVGQ